MHTITEYENKIKRLQKMIRSYNLNSLKSDWPKHIRLDCARKASHLMGVLAETRKQLAYFKG